MRFDALRAVAALIATIAMPGMVSAQTATPPAAPAAPKPPVVPDLALLSPYARPAMLVDIGGRRIDLRCEGKGGPTVILMNGLGAFAMGWYKVQPAIAKRVRTCAFDKASYGHSDPAPLPQSLPDAVDDLHAVLTAAHIAGPYILVGHSAAGLEARLFAQRWPDEVAGMVLVDSSFANQRTVQAGLPGFDAVNKSNTAGRVNALDCIERMARAGFGSATPNYNKCVPPTSPELPADLIAAWPKLFRPSMHASNISLGDLLATPELNSADHLELGNKPLVVLTAGRSDGDPKNAEYTQAFSKIWIERHAGFARMSSRGVHIIVPDTGHLIPYERPEAVIDAVDQVLAKIAK